MCSDQGQDGDWEVDSDYQDQLLYKKKIVAWGWMGNRETSQHRPHTMPTWPIDFFNETNVELLLKKEQALMLSLGTIGMK